MQPLFPLPFAPAPHEILTSAIDVSIDVLSNAGASYMVFLITRTQSRLLQSSNSRKANCGEQTHASADLCLLFASGSGPGQQRGLSSIDIESCTTVLLQHDIQHTSDCATLLHSVMRMR